MIVADIAAGWRRARARLDAKRGVPWSALHALQVQQGLVWQPAQVADRASRQPWADVPAADARRQLRWENGQPRSNAAASGWDQVPAQDAWVVPNWDHSIGPRDARLRLIYNPRPARKDVGNRQAYQRCDEYGPRYDAALQLQSSLYVPALLAFAFAGARYTPGSAPEVFFDFRYVAPARAIQPVDSGAPAGWGAARQLNRYLRLPWGRARVLDGALTGIAYPDYNGPVQEIDLPDEPDILETYMIANSVSVVVLPDRTPLDISDIKLGLDTDSFSWRFSGALFGATSLNLVRPDASGAKTLEITINGWVWLVMVERYTRAAAFPAERYSITGSSRTQLLAEPYAPKRSAMNGMAINAQQAADDQLYLTGFTLTWDVALGLPDWTIPAGALSYQDQTPMQVIARIAAAAGGFIRPARDADALAALPRYREAFWLWGATIMDRIIPAEIITSIDGAWTPQPAWNSVYVSGTNYGVAVDVRRAGTAGDKPAPDVLDDLITATDAARARGICELSKGGNQELVPLTIPLFPVGGSAPGLVEPGHLCEVREVGETWRGLCLGVEISATGTGASRVSQVLTLERHHAGGA